MARVDYSGSCQCGAIAFEVAADLDQAITSNCSRCRRLERYFVEGMSMSGLNR